METGAVTVVIVNYNGGPLLRDCVESVMASTVPVRIVLIDNHSTDDSPAYLRDLHEDCIQVQFNKVNIGFAKAVNQGLRQVETDHVLLLNPDCLLTPDTIRSTRKALDSEPQAGMAGCVVLNTDGSEQRGCRRSIPSPGSALAKLSGVSRFSNRFRSFEEHQKPLPMQAQAVEAISGSFMMVKTAVMKQIGYLDEDYFMHCEDLDWCKRFNEQNRRILFVPDAFALHIRGVSSASRPFRVNYHLHKGMQIFYNKHFDENPALSAAVALGIWSRFAVKTLGQGLKNFAAGFNTRHRSGSDGPAEFSSLAAKLDALPEDIKILVVPGISSFVGGYVSELLRKSNYYVVGLTRKQKRIVIGENHCLLPANPFCLNRVLLDRRVFALIGLSPIWTVVRYLLAIKHSHLSRILVLSSSSADSKRESENSSDKALVNRLVQAEQDIRTFCRLNEWPLTILRPTLIYDEHHDKNVSAIRRFIRRFGFFPLIGQGAGKRQPIHARDIAEACIRVISSTGQSRELYHLVGGETLSYREMVERLFRSMGKPPRFVRVPSPLMKVPLQLLSCLPGNRHLSPSMADRMDKDQIFSNDEFTADFGYKPNKFLTYE